MDATELSGSAPELRLPAVLHRKSNKGLASPRTTKTMGISFVRIEIDGRHGLCTSMQLHATRKSQV